MKKVRHVISRIIEDSIAEELGMEPGDELLKINGQEIKDIFDYQYLVQDEYIEVLIRRIDGEEWLLEIDKEYDEDLGIEFENGLMDDYRS
ncbi:MAG: radical SAM protein, partial [Lachnospiraceae bacterium]|nr:radical SAM protein [Lachnospiraceae bacterium]